MRKIETIVLGGGCFWCTEAIFKSLKGVVSVTPGYAGGNTKNPDYESVSTSTTGHAEVIKVEYNPNIIPTKDLLDIFFPLHNPIPRSYSLYY
jgi:peptide-methionine (S)-S-oxide reductase